MPKGLFFGLTTIDLLYGVANHPLPNEKVKARWQLAFAGGPAANAAVAFSALGNQSHLCSSLGIHPASHLAHKDLEDHNVRLHDCVADPSDAPVLSSILINLASGDRCVVYSNTDNRRLAVDVGFPHLLDGCSILLLDGYYLPQAITLAQYARNSNITVVLDGGSWKNGLDELLPYVDYGICSEAFLPPGCEGLSSIFEYLMNFGMKASAITRGKNAIIAYENRVQHSIAVPNVEIVDTLGAGDIFHGTFCHYILSNSYSRSLEAAAIVASESCRYFGTRQWIVERKKHI